MTLFALADTHLSFGRPKPMDVFGELWRDHPRQISDAWDAAVGPDDVVLVPGDVSWAHDLTEVAPDLDFLAERPGRLKLLLKGNHDSWWGTASKVRRALPEGMEILHGGAQRLAPGLVVCGARGWNLPGLPWFDEEKDRKLYERELKRLDASLAAAAKLCEPDDVLVAMLHYPPLGPEGGESEVTARLDAAGVDLAVYGHLHGDDHDWAPQGEHRGMALRCVASDYVGFAPQAIWSSERGLERAPSVRRTGPSD